jgi:hypothetical protein
MDRQAEPFGGGDQHAAPRGSVQLGHDQPGNSGGVAKNLDLRQGVLAGRRVEHQHHVMRRLRVEPAEHAADLGEFVHQPGLVLEPAGGVDDQHVGADRGAALDPLEHQAGGIAALLAGDDRHVEPLGPDPQLLDRRGAEGVAGDQHHRVILLLQQMGELGDGRRLARSVDPDDQHHLRAREGVHLDRLGDRREDPRDLLGDDGAYAGLVDIAVEPFVRQPGDDARRRGWPKVGGDQRLLDVVERVLVEHRLGEQPGEIVAQPVRGPAQALTHPLDPRGDGVAHAATATSRSPRRPVIRTSMTWPIAASST